MVGWYIDRNETEINLSMSITGFTIIAVEQHKGIMSAGTLGGGGVSAQ